MTPLFYGTDALFLLIVVFCTVIVLQRDLYHSPLAVRASALLFAFFAFSQAMYLLGVYIPGANGFPWPRVALDGSLATVCAIRAGFPRLYIRHATA